MSSQKYLRDIFNDVPSITIRNKIMKNYNNSNILAIPTNDRILKIPELLLTETICPWCYNHIHVIEEKYNICSVCSREIQSDDLIREEDYYEII